MASSSRRQLIMIGPTPPPFHGSAFATLYLIEAAKRAGVFAAHLETGEDDRPVFNTGVPDLTNLYLGIKHVLRLARLLHGHRQASTVSVPISQNRWGFARDATFIWLARLFGRRVIIHLYGGLFGDFYASRRGLERRLIERTFAQISEAWVETPNRKTVFAGLLATERVRVLENTSADIGFPASPPRREDPERLRLLFLANLIPEKGHGDLLAALELLIERGRSEIDLHLVGEVEPAEAELVHRRAAALAEAGIRVELLGQLVGEAKVAQFHWADAYVLPSRYPPEGQPLVLLEAMSAGLPIVSTDHSGIPLTVIDEEQGLIVPPGDIERLADAIARIQDDPELRRRLGSAGRQRFEGRYRRDAFERRATVLLTEPLQPMA